MLLIHTRAKETVDTIGVIMPIGQTSPQPPVVNSCQSSVVPTMDRENVTITMAHVLSKCVLCWPECLLSGVCAPLRGGLRPRGTAATHCRHTGDRKSSWRPEPNL